MQFTTVLKYFQVTVYFNTISNNIPLCNAPNLGEIEYLICHLHSSHNVVNSMSWEIPSWEELKGDNQTNQAKAPSP